MGDAGQGEEPTTTLTIGETSQVTDQLQAVRLADVPRRLHNLAYVALHEGGVERAVALFRQHLDAFRRERIARGIAEGLAGLACVAAAFAATWRAARALTPEGALANEPDAPAAPCHDGVAPAIARPEPLADPLGGPASAPV